MQTRNLNFKLVIVLATLLINTVSCAKRDVFKYGTNERRDPAIGNPLYMPNPEAAKGRQLIFHGYYTATVRHNRNDRIVCEGSAEIITYSDLTITKGEIPCSNLARKITIGDGLERPAILLTPEELTANKLDPRISRITKMGNATYSPNKPDIVGPIIQNPEAYADLDEVSSYSVSFQTGNPEKPTEVAEGSTHVKVLGINETYIPTPEIGERSNVIRYQMNSTGFDTLTDRSKAGIYQVYEYRWNVQPMELLSVHIEGPVQNFGREGLEKVGGNLIFGGSLVIDLNLRELAK